MEKLRDLNLWKCKKVILYLLLFSLIVACNSHNDQVDKEQDVSVAPVTDLTATVSDQQVLLRWSNPVDDDFDYVIISYEGITKFTRGSSYVFSDLNNDQEYIFSIVAFDKNGNSSTEKIITATPTNEEAKVYPTDVIPGLTSWKVTLPIDEDGKDSSDATLVENRNTDPWEVEDEDLIGFEYSPYFVAQDNEVIFRGHCAGATTSGSKYPRSELRQRVGGGNNYWSVDDYQELTTELRVLHTPVEKPEVCFVQIHGPDDEPLRLQFHADKGLYLVWNENNKVYFKNEVPYQLGEKLKVNVVVDKGDITCTVTHLETNDSFSKTWTSMDKTGYFKVGCYTQSSVFLSQFKSGFNDEPADAYGEVAVSKIELTEHY